MQTSERNASLSIRAPSQGTVAFNGGCGGWEEENRGKQIRGAWDWIGGASYIAFFFKMHVCFCDVLRSLRELRTLYIALREVAKP